MVRTGRIDREILAGKRHQESRRRRQVPYITGVSIIDNEYVAVAKQAVKNAKKGVTQVVTTNGSDLVWATVKIDKEGKLSEIKIDTRQGSKGTDGKFVWNEKTKQELQYLYGMHFRDSGIQGELSDAEVLRNTRNGLKKTISSNGSSRSMR